MKRILAIDDDRELCNLLRDYFCAEGFSFDCAHDGKEGLGRLATEHFDMVLLDVMLPERDGFDILKEIRSRSALPVIMLTAKGEHVDRIVGLEIGADDYICKPFNTRELAARVRAVLRRADGTLEPAEDEKIHIDDLEMDVKSRTVTVGGRGVSLTNAEFRLLEILLHHAGQPVPLEELSTEALKRRHTAYDRSISVHMSNLRRKIGTYPSGAERIRTLRGEGFVYVFSDRKDDEGGAP